MKPRLGRDTTLLADEYFRRGQDLFAQTYGETAESVQSLLNGIYPDVGACIHIGWQSSGQSQSYGPRILLLRVRLRFRVLILGRSPGPVHSARETSYTLIAALIASDTPTQIRWHLAGARRNGGSVEQVRAVREMAMRVANAAGVKWKGEVPDVVE